MENRPRPRVGATVVPGGAEFRVWAPGADAVDVIVEAPGEAVFPMSPEAAGFFFVRISDLTAGTRYRFRIDGATSFPDPASRYQPEGVHGPSEVVDPTAFQWSDDRWPGVALADLVIYELHIGTFTPEGTFRSATDSLEHIARLGATAVEIMPVANFPGSRNWGYDGVNLFAPATAYGTPDDLRKLIDRAHSLGIAVLLDVVYNHLGPEGNYLPAVTGGAFFTDRHQTPWGAGINYDGPDSRPIRDLIVGNALHWLDEYHVDGLRLDATHAIVDDSTEHLISELRAAVREMDGPPRLLIAEDERNAVEVLAAPGSGWGLDAVWADDIHHQLRRLTAGDSEGYFANYAGTVEDIAETLKHGWWRGSDTDGAVRSFEPPRFVHCIQNHDQVGNRAFGERLNHQIELSLFRAVSALLLLSPYTPLIWMGQEWASTSPFLFFTDHPEPLGSLVTEGRRTEFRHFSAFADPAARDSIPDPQDPATFQRSRLIWSEQDQPGHAGVLSFYRWLLDLRRTHPAMQSSARDDFQVSAEDGQLVLIRGLTGDSRLRLIVDFGGTRIAERGDGSEATADASEWSLLGTSEDARFGGNLETTSFEDAARSRRWRGPMAAVFETS